MNFILWTLVFWTIVSMDRWIMISKVGIFEYVEKMGAGVLSFTFILNIVIWISLYEKFIK